MSGHLNCSCCGAEITAPQFFKGKAYGYSCILKVNPDHKRAKDGGLWIMADSVEFEREECTAKYNIKAKALGLTFNHFCYGDEKGPFLNGSRLIKSNMIRIAESSNGTGCYWKQIEVTQASSGKNKKLKPAFILDSKNNVIFEF